MIIAAGPWKKKKRLIVLDVEKENYICIRRVD